MKNKKFIRQVSAAFFLLLFAVCVTPKRYLHDLLADHRDEQTVVCNPEEHVTSSGFHCHVDDLVVVAPFLPEIQTAFTFILPSDPVQFSEPVAAYTPAHASHADSRGPPAAFCL